MARSDKLYQLNNFADNPLRSIFVFAAVIVLTHLNIFQNQFVMDDYDYIVRWPLIQSLQNFPQFFIGFEPHPRQMGIYSPLKTLIHALSYRFFRLNPFGYHVLSLGIHTVATFFVFKIARIITKRAAVGFLTAILFCLHPVQVEAITYITASVDMAGIMFLFIAFYYYILSYEISAKQRKYYWMAVIFALMAVFTHELAVSLPGLFFLYNLCFTRTKTRIGQTLIKILPFLGIVAGYVLCKYFVLGQINRNTYLYDSFYLTMLVSVKALAKYVYICLWPAVLTHNHAISEGIYSFAHSDFDKFAVLSQSILDPKVLVSLAVLGAAVYFAWRNYKTNPVVTFCIGWFFVSLLPGLNIIPSGVYFAERYLYPGMLGFCLLAALLFEFWLTSSKQIGKVPLRKIGVSGLIILICFYTTRTWIRNRDWQNEVKFFEAAVRANPNSALMHNDLGIIYTQYGHMDKAVESFKKAIAIRPDDPEFYFAMAETYIEKRNYTQAIQSLNKSIELKEDFAEAHFNLASLYRFLNRPEESKEHLYQALLNYRQQGRTEEAKELSNAFSAFFKSE